MTSSSAGGARTAGGVGHEGRCLAWATAYMLAEVPLPDWASGERVLSVGGQTARPVDDVGLVTASGGWVTIQAKKGLRLDSKAGSALAEALSQLVKIDEVGVPDGGTEQLRPLDADRDLVLILSDDSASLPVNAHMAPLTRRLRKLPGTVPLSDGAVNKDEQSALELLNKHLGAAWKDQRSREMDEKGFRQLVRVLSVRALRIAEGAEDYMGVQVLLRDLAGEATTAVELWNVLKVQAQLLAEERGHLDRDGLVRALERQGVVLRPLSRLRTDIARLQAVSTANTELLAGAVTLTTPEGPVPLARAVEPTMLGAFGNLAITGAPGAGKTVLLHRLAAALRETHDVVLLTSADLRSSKTATRAELGLAYDLDKVLTGWNADRPGLVLLDGIDQARGSDAPDWLPQLATVLSGTRWRLVATVRAFDLKNSPAWGRMFDGVPVDAYRADPALAGVRHLLVDDLTDREIADLRAASPAMALLLDGAGPRLRTLLTNPFNLDLAGQLLNEGATDFTQIHNRAELLNQYWYRRVGQGITAADRTRTVKAIVDLIISDGGQSVRLVDLPIEATQPALELLCRDGVLRETQRPGAAGASVGFWHPVLFDYAVAMLALGDTGKPESLADVLDANPNLALTVRPSLEYRLGFAWDVDQSRRAFWNVALRLALRAGGHPLAATEAARVAALHTNTAEDLAPLGQAVLGTSTFGAANTYTAEARLLAFQFAASVERQPRREAFACLDRLIYMLARHARNTDDIDLALLTAQLPVRVGAMPAGPGEVSDFGWTASAAIDCMAVALKDLTDQRRANLADPCARLLALVAAIDPLAVAEPIAEVIAEPAMTAWGMAAVQHLTHILPAIAAKAPNIAVEIGLALWRHHETRRTATPMLNSAILGLTSNLQQDLEGERYTVGTDFAQLMRINPRAGTSLLLGILNLPKMYHLPPGDPWREPPQVRQGVSLFTAGGFEALLTMSNAFALELEHLADLPAPNVGDESGVLEEIITRLVQELHHGEVWRLVLAHAANAKTPRLAQALLPVLTTSSLYAHYETWTAAAHAARRAADAATDQQLSTLKDAVRGISDAHTTQTRPEHRLVLQERAHKILNALKNPAAPEEETQPASPLSAKTPPDLLPELEDPQADRFFGMWHAEEPMPGSLEHLTARIGDVLQGPVHTDDAGDHRTCVDLVGLWDELAPFLVQDQPGDPEPTTVAVEIAERLAKCPETQPDSHLGLRIVATVLGAVPEAARPLASVEEQQAKLSRWTSTLTAGWGVTAATRAVGAASRMIRSSRWRAAHGQIIAAHLRPLLDDADPVFRYLATDALPGLYPAPEDLIPDLEARLAVEQDRHIAVPLMQMLRWFVYQDPIAIDHVLQRLAELPQWSVLTASPDGDRTAGPADEAGMTVSIIAGLAAYHDTPYAAGVLQAWFSAPQSHPERAIKALHCLHDALRPADPRWEPAQRRVFGLLTQAGTQIRALVANSDTRVDEHQRQTGSTVRFADHLARTLFGVSGALDEKQPIEAPAELNDLRRFAELALPILDALGTVHVPSITLHVVQTIDHIAFTSPRTALLIAAEAVAGDEAYWRDPAGLDAALKLVRFYAAEHRSLFLGDAESTTALRRMLESFVRLGWQQAILLAEELDELFG